MKEIKLFDYQEDMKERIEKALCLHRSVMAQMPTGTGKTVLLASVVESFLREHSNCNVWIVAHRRELVSQIRETIQRVFFESPRPSLAKEGDFSNHPVPLSKEGNFSKTHPSSLTLKGGSTSFPKPLSPQGTGDVTAPPRCSEPLRSKVGGPSKVSPDCLSAGALKGASKRPSKVSPDCAGWDRLGATCLHPAEKVAENEIEVLVSVDLFSEGFDCPDVEFIQLARPTLSLAKYMQMVGRGLRVAEGKEYCVILDNVGLYKRFGLPSVDRDWQSMFEGRTSLEDILQETCMQVNSHNCRMDLVMDGDEEMMKIINHERQQQMIMDTYGYSLMENDKGLLGIKDNGGNVILDCIYKKIEVTNDGFAYCYIRK